MCLCYEKIRLLKTEYSALNGKTHIYTILRQTITPKSMVPTRSYYFYKIMWMGRHRNNNKTCFMRDLIHFVGIALLSTHMIRIVLKQVQERRSSFGLEYTLMSGFGTLLMWIYGSHAVSLIPIRKYWLLVFWSRHGKKFVYMLCLLKNIAVMRDEVCLPQDNMTTLFHHISSPLVIITLYMLLVTVI